jgi:predicted dehydrogenase
MICKALTGAEPSVESAVATTREKDVDSKMSLVLKYPNGVTGFAHGSFEQKEMIAPLTITGTNGSIHIPNFVVTGWDDRIIIESNGKKRTEHLGSLSTYTYQLMALADRIDLGKTLQTDEHDAYATMKVIDAGYTKSGLPLRPTFKIA